MKQKEREKEEKEKAKETRKIEREKKREEKMKAEKSKETKAKDDYEEDKEEDDDHLHGRTEEREFEEENEEEFEDQEEEFDDEDQGDIPNMEGYWRRLNPPIAEEDVIGKWYACIFMHNKSAGLYIGRLKRRFLNDQGGFVLALELDCLERKLGVTDNILWEAKTKDVDVFPVKDVICGPVDMKPLKGGRWECQSYETVVKIFEEVKRFNREQLHNTFVCNEFGNSSQ